MSADAGVCEHERPAAAGITARQGSGVSATYERETGLAPDTVSGPPGLLRRLWPTLRAHGLSMHMGATGVRRWARPKRVLVEAAGLRVERVGSRWAVVSRCGQRWRMHRTAYGARMALRELGRRQWVWMDAPW